MLLKYVKCGGSTAELDSEYVVRDDRIPTVPRLQGVSNVTDVGYGAYMLLKKNADEGDFKDYCQKLLNEGYKISAENKMASLILDTIVC